VILGFACRETERIWSEHWSRRFPVAIQERRLVKLQMLHAAVRLENLRVPPGNRLEALRGDRVGQHSLRVNDRYRIVFRWHEGHVHDVALAGISHHQVGVSEIPALAKPRWAG